MTEHVWLSDEFSLPRERLCMHRPESPNADHGCVRLKGHAGKHDYLMLTEHGVVRDYSWQEARAARAALGNAPQAAKTGGDPSPTPDRQVGPGSTPEPLTDPK